MKKIGFLAADVSKGYADFVLWDQQGNLLESAFRLMDNKEGHGQAKQLVKEFMKHYELTEVYVGMESTGGYENNWFLLFRSMQSQGVSQVMRINWLLYMLQKYPLPSDILKAGKSRLTKISFITEPKAQSIIQKAKDTVAGSAADDLLAASIRSMITVLLCHRQEINMHKKALTKQFGEAQEVQLMDTMPGITAEPGMPKIYLKK